MADSSRWIPFSRRFVRPIIRLTSSTATRTSQIHQPSVSITASHSTTVPMRFLSPGSLRSGPWRAVSFGFDPLGRQRCGSEAPREPQGVLRLAGGDDGAVRRDDDRRRHAVWAAWRSLGLNRCAGDGAHAGDCRWGKSSPKGSVSAPGNRCTTDGRGRRIARQGHQLAATRSSHLLVCPVPARATRASIVPRSTTDRSAKLDRTLATCGRRAIWVRWIRS